MGRDPFTRPQEEYTNEAGTVFSTLSDLVSGEIDRLGTAVSKFVGFAKK